MKLLSIFLFPIFLIPSKERPLKDVERLRLNAANCMVAPNLIASHKVDTAGNDSVKARILVIGKNVERINTVPKWASVKTKDLFESVEGGVAKFFYLNKKLEKITAINYGETFQQISEYYLLNTQLSFVYEKHLAYNRPIFYDTTAMKDNNDTEFFDMNKAVVTEARNYFEKGRIIQRLTTDRNAPASTIEILNTEAKRILADFKKLYKLSIQK